jgi:hypothetical protein
MRHAAGLLLVVVLMTITACSTEPGSYASSCPATISPAEPALQRQYAEFRRSIESAPFARELGPPLTCSARVQGSSVWLVYEYANGGKLEAQRDSAIEFTEQRFTVAGLPEKTALALLQRTERWAFDEKGCGIAWEKPPGKEAGATPDRHDLAYRGAVCNCQGRLEYSDAALMGLVFLSAC